VAQFANILRELRVLNFLRSKLINQDRNSGIKTTSSIDFEMNWSDACKRFTSPNALYDFLEHYYRIRAPQFIREHRGYFSQDNRGFGEDAFHAFWWLLLLYHKPKNCLEIGVYRGQVISLWALIGKVVGIDVLVNGITPLSPLGDSVSGYPDRVNYEEDLAVNFRHFGLAAPKICKAKSTEPAAKEFIKSQKWDLVYIDGGHDVETVLSDYKTCRDQLNPGGMLVFDDAALGFDYSPNAGSFAGHSGPSEVASKVAINELDLIAVVGHNVIFQNGNGGNT
jgi:predicted O-methyltransferase YrrM